MLNFAEMQMAHLHIYRNDIFIPFLRVRISRIMPQLLYLQIVLHALDILCTLQSILVSFFLVSEGRLFAGDRKRYLSTILFMVFNLFLFFPCNKLPKILIFSKDLHFQFFYITVFSSCRSFSLPIFIVYDVMANIRNIFHFQF